MLTGKKKANVKKCHYTYRAVAFWFRDVLCNFTTVVNYYEIHLGIKSSPASVNIQNIRYI